MTDESREGTDHPDPTLSQPTYIESTVPQCTPPETSRTGVSARIRVEHMSPSDKISVRQQLEVDKDNSDVDEEIFTPGFGSGDTLDVGTGGPTKKIPRDGMYEETGGPIPKRSRGHTVHTRTDGPVKDRTGGPLQNRTGGPDTRRPGGPIHTKVTRTGSPVDASKDRTGCSARAMENTGVEPMSQEETDPLGRTRIRSMSQVETDLLGETIGDGFNPANGLGGLTGNTLDLGPADRIASPLPGDYISNMSLSPPNDVPSVSSRARANQADGLVGLNHNTLDQGPADRIDPPLPGDYISNVSLSPPNAIPSVSTRARAHNKTNTINDGPVATIKEREAKGSLPSRVRFAPISTEKTPPVVRVSPISRYCGDISIIGGRLSEKLSVCKGRFTLVWYTGGIHLYLTNNFFYSVRYLQE